MEYLPRELLFSVPPTASASTRSYDTIIRPSGGVGPYVAGQDVRFELPRGKSGTCLDAANSYISFKARCPTGLDSTFDGGPWAAIDRLNIYSGSTIVESVRDYAFIHSALYRLLSPLDAGMTANGISVDPQSNLMLNPVERAAGQHINQVVPDIVLAGSKVRQMAEALAITTSPFQFPLVSGVLGSCAGDRYFPISLTASGLTLELTLADDKMALVSDDTSTKYELFDVRLHVRYVELGDGVMDEIVASNGGETIQIPSESYTSVNTAPIPSGSSSHSAILPLRYRSLKTILTGMRQTASTDLDKHSLATTVNGYSAHQFRINGAPVPMYKIQGVGQAWRALMAAYHMDQGVGGSESSVTMGSWISDTDGAAAATVAVDGVDTTFPLPAGSFMMSADCELFRGKGNLIYNGKETLTSNVELQVEFDAGSTGAVALTTIAHFDTLLSIDVQSGEVSVAY